VGLIEQLAASGRPRKPTCAEFFTEHPGLEDEVREAAALGYTWPAITKALEAEYGWRISPTALRQYMTGR